MPRLVVGATLTVVSIVFLVSGCLGSGDRSSADNGPSAAPNGSANQTLGAKSLSFGKCTELDFVIPIPMDMVEVPAGVKVKPMDPAGLVAPLTVQTVKCAALEADGAAATATTDGYVLYPVEALPGLTLSQAVGYYYLVEVFAGSPLIRDTFAAHGVGVLNGTIQLDMSDVGPLPNVHGTVAGKADDFAFSAETVMEGQPESGAAGTLGIYMGAGPIELHSAKFSAYSSYGTGQAVVQPGLVGLPVAAVDAIATTGSHYWGFDLAFDLGGGTN